MGFKKIVKYLSPAESRKREILKMRYATARAKRAAQLERARAEARKHARKYRPKGGTEVMRFPLTVDIDRALGKKRGKRKDDFLF